LIDETNFLKETVECLIEAGKTIQDVRWVGTSEWWITWNEFALNSNFVYDSGYGGTEINMDLKVVGDNWWLERHEYDGSEWWEYKTLPRRPQVRASLLENDMFMR
jgi:hypothetical protein